LKDNKVAWNLLGIILIVYWAGWGICTPCSWLWAHCSSAVQCEARIEIVYSIF